MPNSTHNKSRKSVSLGVLKRIWDMPCCICGMSHITFADHVIPRSAGGSNEEYNIQPLCAVCNHRKGDRLTNVELREFVRKNHDEHWESIRRYHSLSSSRWHLPPVENCIPLGVKLG